MPFPPSDGGPIPMSPQDLLDLLRKRPFMPFRLFATDGRTYDVRHPDQALVLRTRVILPMPGGVDQVAERSEHLALIHVVRAEELSPDSSPSAAPAG
jgi:hypothetical protein